MLSKIVKKAVKRLKNLGIKVLTGKKIKSAESQKIQLEDGQVLDYDIFIWTGGVKGVSLMESLPLQKESAPDAAAFATEQPDIIIVLGKDYEYTPLQDLVR